MTTTSDFVIDFDAITPTAAASGGTFTTGDYFVRLDHCQFVPEAVGSTGKPRNASIQLQWRIQPGQRYGSGKGLCVFDHWYFTATSMQVTVNKMRSLGLTSTGKLDAGGIVDLVNANLAGRILQVHLEASERDASSPELRWYCS